MPITVTIYCSVSESIPKIMSNIESINARKLLEEFLESVSEKWIYVSMLKWYSSLTWSRIPNKDLVAKEMLTMRSKTSHSSKAWCGRSWNHQRFNTSSRRLLIESNPSFPKQMPNIFKIQRFYSKILLYNKNTNLLILYIFKHEFQIAMNLNLIGEELNSTGSFNFVLLQR